MRMPSQPWPALAAAMLLVACDEAFDLVHVPDIPDGPSNPYAIVQLAVGGEASCVRLANGQVLCWGRHDAVAQAQDVATALPVLDVTDAIDLAAGDTGTCATLANHTVKCWGSNGIGELGVGTVGEIGTPTLVRDQSGNPIDDAQAYAVGNQVSCALHVNGRVSCAGHAGWLGDGTNNQDRTVHGAPVAFIDNALGIEGGEHHMCALTSDSLLKCWGENTRSQLGSPVAMTTTPVQVDGEYIAAGLGDTFSCGIHPDHTMSCWGANELGQLGIGSTSPDVSAPTLLTEITDAISIDASAGSGFAVGSDFVLRAWGWNNYGELAQGTKGGVFPVPQSVNLVGVRAVSSGTGVHACALTNQNEVWCWGEGYRGQLGNGAFLASYVPVQVVGLPQ